MKPTEKQKTIAEQEAERRHEEEIKEFIKAHIDKNVPLLHPRRWWDKCSITIVDSEEARHEKEIKYLLKAHGKDIRKLSRKFDARLKAEREKATDAFCDLCSDRCPVGKDCIKLDFFIEKLNEDDPRDRATSCLSDFQNSK